MYLAEPPSFSMAGRRNALRNSLLFSLAMLAASPAAAIEDWQFQLDAGTGNTMRGLDRSGGDPSVGFAASWYPGSGPFAGLSASEVRLPGSSQTGVEFAADAGYGWRVAGDWTIQTTLTHYQYEHMPLATRMNYDELELRGGWRESVFVAVTASPDTGFGSSPRSRAFSYNLSGRLPLPRGFSISTGIGYYDLRAEMGAGYFYGDAGLTYQFRSVQLDLWYIATRASSATEAKLGQFLFQGLIADVAWHF